METSCIDNEASSTTESVNIVAPSIMPVRASSKGTLCRMGSGTSVVIDSENGVETESRKLPSSKYKGVVPQPNGRWGAQIYEKHQRVWLGTFNEEDEASRVYDIAAQRFRGGDAVTNFKPLSSEEEEGAAELRFLNTRSKAEIVDMLRKHTYCDELQQSKHGLKQQLLDGLKPTSSNNVAECLEYLFEKVITPSDIGKLNRLVIPKQHAEKHFPLIESGTCFSSSKGVLLNFKDVNEKMWRFRYSYWNSSQSYVLTKGWSRFVTEKSLKAGGVVSFQSSSGPDKQLYIDWKPMRGTDSLRSGSDELGRVGHPGQKIRLFGVDICKDPTNVNGKRSRESKTEKQMVVAALRQYF